MLDENKRAATNPPAGTNRYGMHAYELALSSFNCANGDLASLKQQLNEVVVKVLGSKNTGAIADSTISYFIPAIGYIAFSGDIAEPANVSASPYKLFASHYADNSGWKSWEGGEIGQFRGGKFGNVNYTLPADAVSQRQAFGYQFPSSANVTAADYAGVFVKAPYDGALNISSSTKLVVQLGNGRDSAGTYGSTTSHMTFTLELKNDSSTCQYDLSLLADSRPMSTTAGINPYGMHTYEVDLANFTCAGTTGTLDDLKTGVEQFSALVIGGKDADASTIETQTLIQVGWIAFK